MNEKEQDARVPHDLGRNADGAQLVCKSASNANNEPVAFDPGPTDSARVFSFQVPRNAAERRAFDLKMRAMRLQQALDRRGAKK